MIMQRRSFLAGLGAVFAAPAIVQVSSLMVVTPTEVIRGNSLLTIDQITREAVRLFNNSNTFLEALDEQYRKDFSFMHGEQWTRVELDEGGARIGQVLRIRLPKDFVVMDGPSLLPTPAPMPEMAAIGAAAVLAKNPAVSRRFWSRN